VIDRPFKESGSTSATGTSQRDSDRWNGTPRSGDPAEGNPPVCRRGGNALDAITAAVSHISAMNTQIANAAAEQGRVAEEINRNVINISEVAEQTVVGAGQSSAANERITGLAGELQGQVGRFRL